MYNNALKLCGSKIGIQFIPNTHLKNSLAGLSPDAKVTDHPKSGLSFHHGTRIYRGNILVYNWDHHDGNAMINSSHALFA